MTAKLNIKPWYFAEIWCREAAALTGVLSATPTLESVVGILTKTHRSKYKNVSENWIENPLDPAEWLDRILKIDLIVKLIDRNGKAIKVAIDVTLNDRHVEKKMEEIQQPNFCQARKELGIDRH